MAISDIFKLQTGYNLNNTYQDKASWKDAFDIADSFANSSEKQRANREMLATSDWRTAMTNAVNENKAIKEQEETQKMIGERQYLDARTRAGVGYDPQTGRIYDQNTIWKNFIANGDVNNPYAIAAAMSNLQTQAISDANRFGTINPAYTLGALHDSGLTGYTMQDGNVIQPMLSFVTDNNGAVTPVVTNQVVAKNPSTQDLTTAIYGQGPKQNEYNMKDASYKNQQGIWYGYRTMLENDKNNYAKSLSDHKAGNAVYVDNAETNNNIREKSAAESAKQGTLRVEGQENRKTITTKANLGVGGNSSSGGKSSSAGSSASTKTGNSFYKELEQYAFYNGAYNKNRLLKIVADLGRKYPNQKEAINQAFWQLNADKGLGLQMPSKK